MDTTAVLKLIPVPIPFLTQNVVQIFVENLHFSVEEMRRHVRVCFQFVYSLGCSKFTEVLSRDVTHKSLKAFPPGVGSGKCIKKRRRTLVSDYCFDINSFGMPVRIRSVPWSSGGKLC